MQDFAAVQAVAPTTLFAMDRDAFRTIVAKSLGTDESFDRDRIIRERLDDLTGTMSRLAQA